MPKGVEPFEDKCIIYERNFTAIHHPRNFGGKVLFWVFGLKVGKMLEVICFVVLEYTVGYVLSGFPGALGSH